MADLTISSVTDLGMITLRGDLEVLGRQTRAFAGCAAPEQRMSTASDGRRLLWMSPDELLLTCPAAESKTMVASLRAAFGDGFATVVEVGDARAVFDLAGADVPGMLAKLMPVDFDRMAETEIRRSRLAQVPAAIWREGAVWRLVCFRSVARYAEALLRNAAA
ncbi:MAG: sarcosine oxidase subunit gamma family protein [Pseudomonadota bacterium]